MVYNMRFRSLLFVVLALLCNSYSLLQGQRVQAIIYIHGTVASSLIIPNHRYCSSDELDEKALGTELVRKWRTNPKMNRDLIMGLLGLHECISDSLPSWYAARYLIPAYDDIAKLVISTAVVRKYATFGWTGLLHHGARKQAGHQLYKELCIYRNQLIEEYGVEPEFIIVAHSHGGNVALWLADAEKGHHKNVQIKHLVMFGTPIQKSMKECLQSGVFANITLCYSDGDAIQTRDWFSSKDGKSYCKMADVIGVYGYESRRDVRVLVNGSNQHIDHTNMFMMGRSTPLAPDYDLLPLMVLTPFIIQLIEKLDNKVRQIDLDIKSNTQSCELIMKGSSMLCSPALLHKWLSHWNTLMRSEWALFDSDKSRHSLFNKKNWMIAKDMFWG